MERRRGSRLVAIPPSPGDMADRGCIVLYNASSNPRTVIPKIAVIEEASPHSVILAEAPIVRGPLAVGRPRILDILSVCPVQV